MLLLSGAANAQTGLVIVEEVSLDKLRDHCQRLLQALDELKAPLPADTAKALKALLKEEAKDADATAVKIQELLDRHCLIGISINPESRVKAARGPATAELQQERETVVLVKVHNDAGVTHALTVSGPQLRGAGQTGEDRWLEAVVHNKPPLGKALSGQKVEYVVVRLTAHARGKREATLKFDVEQGTQDLGFRSEVPVLFTVKAADR
jgi:hypothetical protein